ncbi:hypothetical protein AB0F15_41415 [Amycolatopsis sp. NPDC026612]|uniref:hypothetical protein n=1 Tax=Amycolatopsis sp. NPDC026612 TaxID=3155466 RepID=UPI0033EB0801
MSNDFDLPPRRPLPDDVRARLRAEVRQGIAHRRPSRVWYAAAVAVVVLAAGAVVATRAIRQPADVRPAPATSGELTLDARVATASLDRCWAAARAAGKAGRLPPREDWVPLFTEVGQADSVVAATAAGKPMFCETTATTVTLSDPGAVPASVPAGRAVVLLHSATGLAGGVLGAGTAEPSLGWRTEGGESGSVSIRSSPVSGQFVALTRTDPARTTLTLIQPGIPDGTVLSAAPPPLLSVADRPSAAERTSPAGRALGACLAAAEEVVPEAEAYAPGPLLETGSYQVVLGRRGDRVLVCTTEPDHQRPGKRKAHVYPDFTGPQALPVRTLRVATLGAVEAGGERGKSRMPFAVDVPPKAAKMTIDFGIGTSAEVDVVNGMAATWIPENIDILPDATVHVVVRDDRGTTLYNGSLPLV